MADIGVPEKSSRARIGQLLFVLLTGLSGLTSVPAGASVQAGLDRQLLPVSAFPKGWYAYHFASEDQSSGILLPLADLLGTQAAVACLADLRGNAKGVTKASEVLVDASVAPVFTEVLATGPKAGLRFLALKLTLDHCKKHTTSSNGAPLTLSIRPSGLPPIGQQSWGYVMTGYTGPSGSGPYSTGELILFKVGEIYGVLDYMDLQTATSATAGTVATAATALRYFQQSVNRVGR